VLQRSAGLSSAALDAIAALEQRVLAVDGGRLKLEWGVLRNRPPDQVNDLLWQSEGASLAGYCGVYQFGDATPEITGMVDPEARRHGIGTALLTAAIEICAARGDSKVLLVVPRTSAGGRALALRHGGELAHSEHALVLDGDPTGGPTDPAVTLRTAGEADVEPVGRILRTAFDWNPSDLKQVLLANSDRERTLVIERGGDVIGTVRLTRDGATGGIYGFAVDAALQGRGIGRDVLRRCCAMLRAEGAARVGLEVEVTNERALGLYTSVGFAPVSTEDYYTLTC
jgi:ribosomal protein S18 acetylase RimI-like enzyme